MKIFAIAAVAAVAGVASADTIVSVDFIDTGAGKNLKITGPNAMGNPADLHVFAGQLKHSISGPVSWAGVQSTFCVEVAQTVTGSPKNYTVKSVDKLPGKPTPLPSGPGGTGMGLDRAKALGHLYDAAAGAQFGSNSIDAAAFQVAVWEIVFDFDTGATDDGISLAGGTFKLREKGSGTTTGEYNDIISLVDTWLGYVTTNFLSTPMTKLGGLWHDEKQDQVVVVPLPAPVAMGLAGLIAVAGVRRLRTR